MITGLIHMNNLHYPSKNKIKKYYTIRTVSLPSQHFHPLAVRCRAQTIADLKHHRHELRCVVVHNVCSTYPSFDVTPLFPRHFLPYTHYFFIILPCRRLHPYPTSIHVHDGLHDIRGRVIRGENLHFVRGSIDHFEARFNSRFYRSSSRTVSYRCHVR